MNDDQAFPDPRALIEVPRRFWGKAYEEDRGTATAFVAKSDYLEHLGERIAAGEGLTLLGPPGAGKSLIAAEIIQAAMFDHNAACYWASADSFARALFRRMEYKDLLLKGYDEYLEKFKGLSRWLDNARGRFKVLVLDDLGAEQQSDRTHFVEGELDRLIRCRGDVGLATVVTSNLNLEGLAKRYSQSLVSYLQEVTTVVTVAGEDQRARG